MLQRLEIAIYACVFLQVVTILSIYFQSKNLKSIKEKIRKPELPEARPPEGDIHVDLHNRLMQLQQTNYARKYPRR